MLLLVRGRDREKARRHADELAALVERHPLSRDVRIAGPAPAPLERLKGAWRFQILLRHPSAVRLREIVSAALPRITSYNVCYTKLLRVAAWPASRSSRR